MKKKSQKLISVFLTLIMLMGTVSVCFNAFAAGSAQLNTNEDGYRFYTEYFNRESAGLTRKTIVKCYLMRGETAYFGSSVADSRMNLEGTDVVKNSAGAEIESGNDIVVTNPDGTMVPYDVISGGQGYISNYTQEKNGPKLSSDDSNDKYEPLSFTAQTEGIYTFEFHSQRGIYSGLSQNSPTLVDQAQDQRNFTVAHWDITVVGENSEPKTGRIWTTLLAVSSGAAKDIVSNLMVYVLTNDGYIYKVKFNDIIPFGFTFFANNQGFTTTGQTPYSIYHSFYDNDNQLGNIEIEEGVTIHKPSAPDSEFAQTFKIFFEEPSKDLIGKVYNEPAPVEQITDITFHGGQTQGTTSFRQGGYFTFISKGATTATITIDFRESLDEIKAEAEAEGKPWAYNGSGIVELSGAVVDGENQFYWDGKDTSGVAIPVGVYGKNEIRTVSEAKGGEVHFPFIDVEGLVGGVEIERLNGEFLGDGDKYDIYYNNNPLAYNTIEYDTENMTRLPASLEGNYAVLSDGTMSRGDGFSSKNPDYTGNTGLYGGKYFETLTLSNDEEIKYENISTLYKDTPEYLYNKEHGEGTWNELSQSEKDEFTAECAKYEATYHHEPNNSQVNTIRFDSPGGTDNASGGGNQAGIDIWTYYTPGASSKVKVKTDILIMNDDETGKISGRVFYDEEPNREYNFNKIDYPLKGIEVELVDEKGNPITSVQRMPVFDEDGYFKRDSDGKIIFEEQTITFKTTTNKYGVYTFTGVPVSPEGKTYYAHVLLTQEQAITLGYRLTTTSITNKDATATALEVHVGPDGNKRGSNVTVNRTDTTGTIAIGGLVTFDEDKTTIFDKSKAQAVTIKSDDPTTPAAENVGEFNDIGYHTSITIADQMNYQVSKSWPADGTTRLDSITVMFYAWDENDTARVTNDNGDGVNKRTGNLIDTVKLSAANNWTYTWHHLDKNLKYYIVEYYTKTNDAGQIMKNDKGDEILVLAGGTRPIYSSAPAQGEEYYPESVGSDILKEYFGDGEKHSDAITEDEKQTTADSNALLFDMTYELTVDVISKTNIINLTNSQLFDEREYYVWLDHETELPNFVSKTKGSGIDPVTGKKAVEAKELEADENGQIKNMTITSLDANVMGDAMNDFAYDSDNPTSVIYTATKSTDYPRGTGTRTYKVTYDDPDDGKDTVFSWTLTIHVYDVNTDYYVLDYGLKAKLQQAEANAETENRKYMLLSNDVLRVAPFKKSVNTIMNTCADFAGVAFSPDGLLANDSDAASLEWSDSIGNSRDKYAEAEGENGILSVNLTTSRSVNLNRGDDHANYAEAVFTPTTFMSNEDVFYYRIVVFGESVSNKATADYSGIDATNGVIMYAPVIVMPASTVYYEDGYRFSTQYSKNNFEIESSSEAVITADNGYQSISTDDHYGYDDAYLDPSSVTAGQYDSLGSSTNVSARSSNFTFDFKGTGFDILGRTDSTAARLTYRVEKKAADGTYKLYQGSTVDASYIDTNGAGLYQLPVISVKNLDYGEYRVKTYLMTTTTGTYHFNLDGIRIYDPLGKAGSKYYIRAERGATVTAVRDMVLGTLKPEDVTDGYMPSDASAAIIYSENPDGSYYQGSTVTEIRTSSSLVNHSEDLDDYLSVGPKCELYIPSGSGIAFDIKADSTPLDNTLQIELKAIYDGDEGASVDGGYGSLLNVTEGQQIDVLSSTSMYYELDTSSVSEGGTLILVNNSDYTVSVSNLKYKGYQIAYPDNFLKADALASRTEVCDSWADDYTPAYRNVLVTAANFATSYARAGHYIDINVTVVEPVLDEEHPRNSAFRPILFDENGNEITLSENDITPVRLFKTAYKAIDEEGEEYYARAYGYVYKIRLMVPEDTDYLTYTVGAVSRSEITITDENENTTTSVYYSENGHVIGIIVKPYEIFANVSVMTVASAPRMMRVLLTADEPISTTDSGWTQTGEDTIVTELEEPGEYAVTLSDIDGYTCVVTFTLEEPEEEPPVVTPDEPEKEPQKSVLEKILDFFKKIIDFISKFF